MATVSSKLSWLVKISPYRGQEQAIEQLPMESRLVNPQRSQTDASENPTENDPQPTAQKENSPPNSPTKGTLNVKNYG